MAGVPTKLSPPPPSDGRSLIPSTLAALIQLLQCTVVSREPDSARHSQTTTRTRRDDNVGTTTHTEGRRHNATSHNCVNLPSGLICTTVGENLCGHPAPTSGPLSPISKLMFATTTTSAPLCESPHHDNQCTMQRRTTQGSSAQPTVGENCDHPAWIPRPNVPNI